MCVSKQSPVKLKNPLELCFDLGLFFSFSTMNLHPARGLQSDVAVSYYFLFFLHCKNGTDMIYFFKELS